MSNFRELSCHFSSSSFSSLSFLSVSISLVSSLVNVKLFDGGLQCEFIQTFLTNHFTNSFKESILERDGK